MSSADPSNSGPAAIQSRLCSNALSNCSVSSLSLASALMNRNWVLAAPRRSFPSRPLLGLGLFLFGRGVLAFDRLLDLLHELLKAHDQHVRAIQQPLVPVGDGRGVDVGTPPLQHRFAGGLGGVVLELRIARGLGRSFGQQVRRTVRAVGTEQLDEQPGLREVGVEGFGEFGPALLVVALRQDLGAELIEIGDDLVALVIEVVGDLGEQDGLAGERTLGVRPASATGRGSSAAAPPSGAPAPAGAARICPD